MATATSTPTHTSPEGGRTPEPAGRRNSLLAALRTEDFWTTATAPVALTVVVVVFSLLSPRFFTVNNIDGMLADSTIPVLLALAATFAVTLAGIDLSLAATVALGSVTFGTAYEGGQNLLICTLVAIATGVGVGLINGFFVGWVRIPDFIVTLGTLSLVMGLGLVISDGQPVQTPHSVFITLTTNSVWFLRYNILLVLGVALLLHIVLFRTRFGTHLLATGDNQQAARAMGVKVARVKLAGYALCGGLGGLAAVALVAYIGSSQPAVNNDYLLKAIAAVVLGGVSLFGGRATIWGPVLGAILLTVLQQGLTLIGVDAYYEPIVIGIVVLGAATLMRGQK